MRIMAQSSEWSGFYSGQKHTVITIYLFVCERISERAWMRVEASKAQNEYQGGVYWFA